MALFISVKANADVYSNVGWCGSSSGYYFLFFLLTFGGSSSILTVCSNTSSCCCISGVFSRFLFFFLFSLGCSSVSCYYMSSTFTSMGTFFALCSSVSTFSFVSSNDAYIVFAIAEVTFYSRSSGGTIGYYSLFLFFRFYLTSMNESSRYSLVSSS